MLVLYMYMYRSLLIQVGGRIGLVCLADDWSTSLIMDGVVYVQRGSSLPTNLQRWYWRRKGESLQTYPLVDPASSS